MEDTSLTVEVVPGIAVEFDAKATRVAIYPAGEPYHEFRNLIHTPILPLRRRFRPRIHTLQLCANLHLSVFVGRSLMRVPPIRFPSALVISTFRTPGCVLHRPRMSTWRMSRSSPPTETPAVTEHGNPLSVSSYSSYTMRAPTEGASTRASFSANRCAASIANPSSTICLPITYCLLSPVLAAPSQPLQSPRS